MSHTSTSRAIQKTSSGTAYCRLSNILLRRLLDRPVKLLQESGLASQLLLDSLS